MAGAFTKFLMDVPISGPIMGFVGGIVCMNIDKLQHQWKNYTYLTADRMKAIEVRLDKYHEDIRDLRDWKRVELYNQELRRAKAATK